MAVPDKCPSPSGLRVSPFSVRNLTLPDNDACSHPTEPQCSYDPVEGLPIASNADPSERMRMLEEQISTFMYHVSWTRNLRD